MSLGLRNASTKKVWKNALYRDWATRQAKGEEEEGKQEREGRDRSLRGRGREEKSPKSLSLPAFLRTLPSKAYMKARLIDTPAVYTRLWRL